MTISSKRAEYVAWAAVVLTLLFFGICLLTGRWSGFEAISETSWFILSAVLIWFVLLVQFHQRSLAEQEKLDIGRLSSAQDSTAIFQTKGGEAEIFAVAQRRLAILEKWFLPVFSAVIAIYQIAIGIYLLKSVLGEPDITPKQPLVCAIYMTSIAFVSFLLSRYATGMSAQNEWKPLRAGGSVLLAAAVLCFVLAVALALAQFKIFLILNLIGWVIPGLLIIIGIETALNTILDIYRPRLKGQYSRSAFDSRLLGILNEPGGIFHTAASAIDYQFGFKVSHTWFYKLLVEKAIVPLILFGAVSLYLLSCIVVVNPDEQAIIEHFGSPVTDANDVRIIGPGMAFKKPWPIDIAYKYPTKKVMELSVGFIPDTDPEGRLKPILWGNQHHEKEYHLLVAGQVESGKLTEAAVPVSIIIAAVPVQYRIKDLYAFIYNHSEPEKLLEAICYHELTRFAASAKIEVDDANLESSLLGAGRAKAKKTLTKRIQAAADKAGLGIEVVFLGLQGIHPPEEVAADYQKVIGAGQKKQTVILYALSQRNLILTSLAGSVEQANRLYDLTARYQQAKQQNDTDEIQKISEILDHAFGQAKGEIFSTLRQSESYAFEKQRLAQATGLRFASQVKAYNAAPEIYTSQQRLAMFEEAMGGIRKFLIVADDNDTQVFTVDIKEKLTPSLYDIGGIGKEGGQ
jgi:regulator of protease activity HflC (stomatin/prohibitin superfamily)